MKISSLKRKETILPLKRKLRLVYVLYCKVYLQTQGTSDGDCWNSKEIIHPPTDAEDAFRKINSVGELICQPEQVMM